MKVLLGLVQGVNRIRNTGTPVDAAIYQLFNEPYFEWNPALSGAAI